MSFVVPNHERKKPDADLLRELYPARVQIGLPDLDERSRLIIESLEILRQGPPLRSSVILIPGAIERLQKELSRLLRTDISVRRLASIISGGCDGTVDALRKALQRAAKGKPTQLTLVKSIAVQIGVDPSDFVILGLHTHPVGRISARRRSAQTKDHGAGYGRPGRDQLHGLREQQRNAHLAALGCVQIPLDALQDDAARKKLLTDLRSRLVVVELPVVEQNTQAGPRQRSMLADLLARLRQPSTRSRVTPSFIVKLIDAAAKERRFLRVARFVGVTERHSSDPDEPTWPERHLRIVLTDDADLSSVGVDFRPFAAHLPTQREHVLWDGGDEHDPGARQALSSIRADIRWCGHWEGRWLPIWPFPANRQIYAALRSLSA